MARSTTARPVTQSRFIGRTVPIGHCRDGPCLATDLSTSPSTRMISASVTSSNRAALSAIACSAISVSAAELAIARSTSAVASCRTMASASSRSRASSCLFSSATEIRAGVARVLAFVPGERSLRPCVRLFAPLRDKVTSSHGLRLLRPRRQRPEPRRAAQQRDELPPRCHSITSSARAIRGGGTVRPSALAVFRLMISSTLVDCWTGRSAGFSPLRMRPA